MAQKKSEIPGLVQGVLNEFFDIIDDSFVSHFINIHSIKFYRTNYIPKLKEDLLQDAHITGQRIEDIYQKACHIGDEDETQSMVYQTTFGQVISIAEAPGQLENRKAGDLIVTIYQYWEDTYRGRIAEPLGIKKSELKGDIWGDLRLVRQSILHHKFIAKDEITQCKIIKSFSPGKPIKLTYAILNTIKLELHKWCDGFMYDVINQYKTHPPQQPKQKEQLAPNL